MNRNHIGVGAIVMLAATAVPASAAMLFDVSTASTSVGPPYPTSATQTDIFEAGPSSPTQIGTFKLGIWNVTATPLVAHIQSWDAAGGPGVLSPSAILNPYLESSEPMPPSGANSYFDIWMEPLTSNGDPAILDGAGGGFGSGTSNGKTVSRFDVTLNVFMDGGILRQLRLHGETDPNQPLRFAAGSRMQTVGGKLHVIPNLVFDGALDPALPLFTMTLTPEPASAILLVTGLALACRRR